MAFMTYIEHDGSEHKVEVADGDSVMHGALNNGVEGIVGECGGGLACATCHCYVDAAWIDRAGTPSQEETEMLEAASAEVKPNSRLSCQLVVSDELDGLVVRLPESQY
ncbi:MAG TPA: 2Fe-2S iron-sulfur cluster-binding protein [Sphingobium sp.]